MFGGFPLAIYLVFGVFRDLTTLGFTLSEARDGGKPPHLQEDAFLQAPAWPGDISRKAFQAIKSATSQPPHPAKSIPTCNPKQPFINGCFNWMIPNLYIENGCFTKHPFINGCLGFQEILPWPIKTWSVDDFDKIPIPGAYLFNRIQLREFLADH